MVRACRVQEKVYRILVLECDQDTRLKPIHPDSAQRAFGDDWVSILSRDREKTGRHGRQAAHSCPLSTQLPISYSSGGEAGQAFTRTRRLCLRRPRPSPPSFPLFGSKSHDCGPIPHTDYATGTGRGVSRLESSPVNESIFHICLRRLNGLRSPAPVRSPVR